MPWARFEDRFPSNRKIRLLSDGAFRLYVSAICWSSENLTDGVITKRELRLVADVKSASRRAQELVDAGLWEVLPEAGWLIHDYEEYQPTASQVRADRKAKTARQQRWRDRQKGDDTLPPPPPPNGHVDASTDATRDASQDAAPRARVPDPTRPTTYMGVGSERGAGSSARGHEPDLSHIDPAWQPSEQDYAAAAGDVDRLGEQAVQQATAKFVRHHQAKATTVADFGPLWVTWLTRERAPQPQPAEQTGVVVPFQPAGTFRPSTTDQRVADAMDVAARLAAKEQ